MSKRRALLIGVPEYESDAIPNLPIVRKDLEMLHGALEKSGFTVRSLGADGISHGRSKIRQALIRECKEARGIETLLLYFSGHGIHFQGKDYLVPADAVLDYAEFVEECLVPIDLSDIVDQSGAGTIIFFVDACREGVKLDSKALSLAGWSQGELKQATRRSFVLVFACGPGQVSQYVSGEAGFSLFSQALAEVLDPQHFACTLRDVLDETQARLNALAAEHRKQPQKIYYAHESGVEEDIASRIICNGLAATGIRDKTTNPWSDAVLQSSFWQEEAADENSSIVQLKRQVDKVLAACWQQWQAAVRAFPQDSWRDEELPIRVLRSLELLIFRSNPPIKLTDAEIALVVTVPFVREAVLANGIAQAAKVSPLALEAISPKNKLRDALDKIHQAQPRFVRKAERLKDQGRTADKDAVMTWLLHLCLWKNLETWQPESTGGYLTDSFIKALDSTEGCRSRLVKETLTSQRLLELAYCIYADFERIDRDDRPNALQARLIVGSYREEQVIREKMLAYVLKLAGLLAIDIRTLSDVLVDHIGLADPLTPEQVLYTVNQTRWNPSGQGRTLTVTCNHPAIDLSLTEYVGDVGAVLSHMLRQVEDKRGGMEALTGLPTHLQPDGIEAEKRDGAPVYQIPHINFQLAHDEVRELLMGEQLYGDPMLAIRELYQNAMDACRYRDARLKYLKQTGKAQRTDEEWEGRIIFRQRTDDNGRAYIECEDNGIGMGISHLSKCFAQAGRRFADLPEFIEEQAEWLKCDPPIRLYPNSQFGVGVLSYFMLADEIEVETCRLDREGRPGERLQVRIPGSSGLFRVRKPGIGSHSGTRVRLYLSQTSYKGKLVSCIEILRQLLWVAEFKTEIQQGVRCEVWYPGQLKHPELQPSECLKAGDDVWWVPERPSYGEQGCILADGLWTEESQSGAVINLRQTHYPKLTVDRKNIVDWDRKWVHDALVKSSEFLEDWTYLTFNWLLNFGWRHPHVAEYIVKTLSRKKLSLKLGRWNGDNVEVPITEVGCFQSDLTLIQGFLFGERIAQRIPWWILPYRVAIWGKYGLVKQSTDFFESLSLRIQAHPYSLPQAGDTIALSNPIRLRNPSVSDVFTGRIPIAHLVLVSSKLGEPITTTLKRLQKFIPLGLEVSSVEPEVLKDISLTQEDLFAFSDNTDNKNISRCPSELSYDYVSPAYLILTAARLNEPVVTTLKRFQKLTPLGLEVPQINEQLLSDLHPTQEDLIALSRFLDGQRAWNQKEISVAQIVLASAKLNEPIVATLQRLQRFEPLGLKIPEVDNVEALTQVSVTPEDLIILSEYLNGRCAWQSDQLSISHIILSAIKFERPVSQIIQCLQRFTVLGLEVPTIGHLDTLENLIISQEDIILLSSNLDGEGGLYEDQISSSHILKASVKLNKPIAYILQELERFTSFGLRLPDIDLEMLGELTLAREDLIPFTEGFDGQYSFLEGEIHPSRIFTSAWILGESLTTTLEKMRRLAPTLGVTLPEEHWFFDT